MQCAWVSIRSDPSLRALFDREFPGHYLRLVRSVSWSIVALLSPGRGLRATAAASGVSRTVVARGPFDTVTLRPLALEAGVAYVPGAPFGGAPNELRVSFSYLGEPELETAASRLSSVVASVV